MSTFNFTIILYHTFIVREKKSSFTCHRTKWSLIISRICWFGQTSRFKIWHANSCWSCMFTRSQRLIDFARSLASLNVPRNSMSHGGLKRSSSRLDLLRWEIFLAGPAALCVSSSSWRPATMTLDVSQIFTRMSFRRQYCRVNSHNELRMASSNKCFAYVFRRQSPGTCRRCCWTPSERSRQPRRELGLPELAKSALAPLAHLRWPFVPQASSLRLRRADLLPFPNCRQRVPSTALRWFHFPLIEHKNSMNIECFRSKYHN